MCIANSESLLANYEFGTVKKYSVIQYPSFRYISEFVLGVDDDFDEIEAEEPKKEVEKRETKKEIKTGKKDD